MRGSAASSGHQQPRLRSRTASSRTATTLVLLGLVWFMFCAAFQVTSVPGTTGRTTQGTTALSTELLKRYLKLVASQERRPQGSSGDLDLNYVSKRRVPNGPDPIHNRRVVKYRQPPGA